MRIYERYEFESLESASFDTNLHRYTVVSIFKAHLFPNEENKYFMKNSRVHNIKPLGFQWQTRDPYIFCVHHQDRFPKGQEHLGPDPVELRDRPLGHDFTSKNGWRMYHGSTVPGFPRHPHRGFETVTVVRQGFVDHSDSIGAAGRYGNGDVQWMTAGKGIQHAEMFPLINTDKENPLELFQIWINLPRKNKFVNPYFSMFWGPSIPTHVHVDSEGKETRVEVIAGILDRDKAPLPPPDSWASDPDAEVAIWNIRMQAGANWTMPDVSEGINRTIYLYEGNGLSIENIPITHYHSAELIDNKPYDFLSGAENCSFLLLQGKPIGEPLVQHGPFVMNTEAEIREAFRDFRETQFGNWPWHTDDPVHSASRGRFALHADGREEKGA